MKTKGFGNGVRPRVSLPGSPVPPFPRSPLPPFHRSSVPRLAWSRALRAGFFGWNELDRRRGGRGVEEFARVGATDIAFGIAAEHAGDFGDAVIARQHGHVSRRHTAPR